MEFRGLNPDVFPQAPKVSEAEVVEIAGNAGTEVDGDDGPDD